MAKLRTFEIPLEWVTPDSVISRLATNMIVQFHQDTFLISFYETIPPQFLGSEEDIEKQIKKQKTVKTICFSRIAVSAVNMPNFIKALESNYEKYQQAQESQEEKEGGQDVESDSNE